MKKYHIVVSIILMTLFNSCKENGKEKLIIFHAGSLAVPVRDIIEEYQKENPNIEILTEISGSLHAARKITELDRYCDLIMLADFHIFDNILIPEHTDTVIKFAGNEMLIVYNNLSNYSDEINSSNWIEILSRKEVSIGRSDPNSDPCGYRTIFVFKLAELFYQSSGLANFLINKEQTVIRPKEVDLLAILETGNVDYVFIYKSIAIQHKLDYISLPTELNLGNSDFADYYQQVDIEVPGARIGETVNIQASPIVYGMSITRKSENKQKAQDFVNFIQNPEKGEKILKKHGMSTIIF